MRFWYDTEFLEDGETIKLLSLGMVAEDGRELYLQTMRADFLRRNPNHCSNEWVRENVIPHLSEGFQFRTDCREQLLSFVDPEKYGKPEFWGYYSAYDHVALCQIFGTMMDLPKSWPMLTMDVKQLCVSLGNPRLPEQKEGKHNALADARWTKEAWEFLTKIQESE